MKGRKGTLSTSHVLCMSFSCSLGPTEWDVCVLAQILLKKAIS